MVGSSALKAAIWRALRIEIANSNGLAAILLLWDAAKFYDQVDLGILLEKSL